MNHFKSCFTDSLSPITTLRPKQKGRYFPDDIFKPIFSNENARISIHF